MGKRRHERDERYERGEDTYGQMAGAIGVLVISFGGLAAIKDKLGLSWPATVLLTAGVLVALGYGAWWLKTRIQRAWASKGQEGATKTVLAQEAGAEDEGPARDEGLTKALVASGAIAKDQFVRADESVVTPLPHGLGTRHEFKVPLGRTYKHVATKAGEVAGALGATRLRMQVERGELSERDVDMTVLTRPPFTEPFAPPTREMILAHEGIPFSHSMTGELVGIDDFTKGALFVAGMTQTGKSTLTIALITCAYIAYGPELDVYLIEGKPGALVRFEKVAVRYEASSKTSVFDSMVCELLKKQQERYEMDNAAMRERKPKPRHRQTLFIADEVADYYVSDGSAESKKERARLVKNSSELVRKGLECGITVIMMTQRPSDRAVPVEVRDQFKRRICLYVSGKGSAEVALGSDYFKTESPIHPALMDASIQGQGVYFDGVSSKLIRGIRFDDEFIFGVVDDVYERRHKVLKTALEETPDTPLVKAIDVMQKNGAAFMSAAELAPFLGVVETNATQRGKAVSALLGIKPAPNKEGTRRGYDLARLVAAAQANA
ncbi:FtsK/SpoIIIE domain-containing protein [Streptomyces flavofungini]|uniref:FtsK/SpoIIIE domain-containing protein n=1 Tax=Streptomyces flavofungini TaxID=68200 RepID=UPI0025B191B3|nr:FtsK/SpoIIIE domain-containing protein [Streptomyces flavofungini]WJV51841.1 FtsK/SpoIIIE domain-containing protein [Streptomyces flavofungini]WJV51877.1 FtsK/SpoIIIE domain-containing protein [Streptomyces flavofungini]